jgi:hypothetical protein
VMVCWAAPKPTAHKSNSGQRVAGMVGKARLCKANTPTIALKL